MNLFFEEENEHVAFIIQTLSFSGQIGFNGEIENGLYIVSCILPYSLRKECTRCPAGYGLIASVLKAM